MAPSPPLTCLDTRRDSNSRTKLRSLGAPRTATMTVRMKSCGSGTRPSIWEMACAADRGEGRGVTEWGGHTVSCGSGTRPSIWEMACGAETVCVGGKCGADWEKSVGHCGYYQVSNKVCSDERAPPPSFPLFSPLLVHPGGTSRGRAARHPLPR